MAEIVRLSVLDQSPVPAGTTGAEALHNTLDLARLADALGFHRYWVAEHHGGPALAGASPEVLIGPIAAATRRIRVGSGGVMLPHYSPLKVAESFSILAGLFPGRIDLGVGRTAGTDDATARLLQRDRRHAPPDDFTDQLAELLGLVDATFPPGHPLARLASVLPGRTVDGPRPWLLGSSWESAIWAGELGLPYAFADFVNPYGAGHAALYHERFEPSSRLARPRLAVAAWTVVAETDGEAERLAASTRMTMAMRRRGEPIQLPPVEEAVRFMSTPSDDLSDPLGAGRRGAIGSPATVRAGLEELASDYGADEVIAVTATFDHDARRRSYELLADAFGLSGARDAEPELAHAQDIHDRSSHRE